MKKLCTLFLVFVAIAAYAQNDGKDYIKFDENGNITEFRQTTKDGTVFQLWRMLDTWSASELSIDLPDGTWANGYIEKNVKDLYNSIKNGTVDVIKEMNEIRGFQSVKDESRGTFNYFDEKFIPTLDLSDEDAHKTNLSDLVMKIEQHTQNSMIVYFTCPGNSGNGYINTVCVIKGSCGLLNDTYGDGSNLYIRPKQGFQYGQDIEKNCEGVLGVFKKVSDGVLYALCVEDKIAVYARPNDREWMYDGTITGNTHKVGNRWSPKSGIGYYDIYCMDKGFFDTITSVKYLPFYDGKLARGEKISEYKKGVLYSITDEKGLITIYDKDGNIDEFETERNRQMAEAKKKKDEEYKKQEAQKMAEEKKQREQLNKKYGAKWVQAVEDGELLVGMPFDLFAAGVKNQYFTKPNLITSAEKDYESNGRQCWKVYGYKGSDSAFNLLLTNPKLIGWVYITNGKVSSISWK